MNLSEDPFWAELGYSDERCPTCGVRMIISNEGRGPLLCLNACALSQSARDRFSRDMKQIMEEAK